MIWADFPSTDGKSQGLEEENSSNRLVTLEGENSCNRLVTSMLMEAPA